MSSESLQKYEFKQSLERIKNHRGHATELVSLYIPPDRRFMMYNPIYVMRLHNLLISNQNQLEKM